MLAIEPKVARKDRVPIRAGRTSPLRTLLDEAFCLKAECFLD
jgi:hypothetical protein